MVFLGLCTKFSDGWIDIVLSWKGDGTFVRDIVYDLTIRETKKVNAFIERF